VTTEARTAPSPPAWLFELLGVPPIAEGATAEVAGRPASVRDGVLRLGAAASAGQRQTAQAFGYKWSRRDTFESPAMRGRMRAWLVERYGEVENAGWWSEYGEAPTVLDAGCGAAWSALELFGRRLAEVRYVGVDISDAIDVAAARLREASFDGAFVQADLGELPLPDGSVNVAFSEGVLHHTDSTEASFHRVAQMLAPGGRFLFYVYRRKGPIREYTDDYVRGQLQAMTPEEAWNAMAPLTKLGRELGRLDVEVDVPEDVDVLGIPAGRIDIQRLFYWHVVKAYYAPELTFEELNHINFDWFAPRNAHRHAPEEVRAWCRAAGLEIEREDIQDSGITVIARRID
jgi:SAM-dependent methyltransferase